MPIYVKPNGTEIDINDNAVSYAESLGWTAKGAKKAPAKKKAAKKKSKAD